MKNFIYAGIGCGIIVVLILVMISVTNNSESLIEETPTISSETDEDGTTFEIYVEDSLSSDDRP